MWRWLKRIGVALVLLLVIALAGGYLAVRGSLPEADGQQTVVGIGGPVEIIRDAYGVPHIFADTDADAAFALGWVHAQDRFVQMETMRRLGAGRTSEVVGEWALGVDRYMRTLGLHRLAEEHATRASPALSELLTAYAAGVNAWLEQRPGLLPPELLALGVEPEPWTPADSLVWGRLMGMRLAGNRHEELLRTALADRLSPERIDELWPPYPADAPTTVEPGAATAFRAAAMAMLDADPVEAVTAGGASNIWIVSGDLTDTGKPILANDPHLGLSMPGTWYLARLVTPERSLAGATTPGVPLVILGQNDDLAWGFTTTTSDIEDLFVETIDTADPNRYLTPEGSQPFETRTELIKVRGGDDVEMTVRTTRHGPVVSGVLMRSPLAANSDRPLLALAATYLADDDRAPEAVLGLNRAKTSSDVLAALRDFTSPPQNIGWATVDGDIGLMVAGRIPKRSGTSGLVPTDGASGGGDWSEWLVFEDLPKVQNPSSGRIINANNRITPTGAPDPLYGRYDPGFRASRIQAAIDGTPVHNVDTLAAIQVDAVSEMARALLPLMLAGLSPEVADRPEVAALRTWDGTMDRERPEPLVFAAWYAELHSAIFGDEVDDLARGLGADRPIFIARVLEGDTAWCDDIATTETETCEQVVTAALQAALQRLSERHGDDPTEWRWGDAHPVALRHPLAGRLPVVGGLFNRELPVDGGLHTPLRAAYWAANENQPFAAVHGAGYRAVYDLADPAKSRFVIATGESGHPLSPHYGDMAELWRDGDAITLGQDRGTLRETASGRLLLAPPVNSR